MSLYQNPKNRKVRMAKLSISRRVALLAAATATTIALVGCAPAEEASDLGQLDVQFSWIKNAEFSGEFLADSNGYYAEEGFSSVNFIAGPTATAAVVLSGGALVGLSDAIAVTPVILE
jgi:ABC-type nitrate/sulfonate/bicarbonate transport system substrate-binding protein